MTRARRAAYPGAVAIDPSELADDFGTAAATARRRLAEKGELSPPNPRPYVSPLDDEEREAVLELLRIGAYAQAGRRRFCRRPRPLSGRDPGQN